MIMNIYTIQDLDLDVKNFHNKFNSSILFTLPISLSVLVATGFVYLISIAFVYQFLI